MSTADRASSSAQDHILQVQGLTKRYGSRQALAGLSLTVRSGEIVGLVGANGGGKTTSLRILAGLLALDDGRGTVLGCDLVGQGREIRRRVGYLPQRFSLYPTLSVEENLRFRAEVFGVDHPRQVVAALIDRFGLRPFAGMVAERLSGGWARLLQFAAALVHRPSLVLLDEPTAGLDAAARQAVWRQMAWLAGEGASIVLSTHDLADASRCSRIVFLSGGIVRGSGRPTDVARATRSVVLAVRGDGVLGLVEPLQSIPSVIASYPSGDSLRVLVTQGGEGRVAVCCALREFSVEQVIPTLEDAVLEWSGEQGPGSA